MIQPTNTTNQKVTSRKINTDPRAMSDPMPAATSPADSTPSTTPKPPGVRLKLLAAAPAQ
jgi:hypothetical protein